MLNDPVSSGVCTIKNLFASTGLVAAVCEVFGDFAKQVTLDQGVPALARVQEEQHY